MEKEKDIENKNLINHSRRKLLGLAGAASAGALLSPLLSKATLSTVIEAGSNVDTASYIIFKDGNMVYAKNGTTGEIQFRGEDASGVIQNALDNFTDNGGKIYIKTGIYTITSPININTKNTIIEGENVTTTKLDANNVCNVININGLVTKALFRVSLKNIHLYRGIIGLNATYWVGGHIENVNISYCTTHGIYADHMYTNMFENVESKYNTLDGVHFEHYNNQIGFYNCAINENNRYGFNIIDGVETYLVNCNAEQNKNYGILLQGCYAGRISGYFESNAHNNTTGDRCQIYLKNGPVLGNCLGITIDASYFNGGNDADYGIKFGNATQSCSVGKGCFFGWHAIASINITFPNTQVSIDRFWSRDLTKIIDSAVDTKIVSQSGYVTENNILSGTFAIDSTGIKTVTMAHGLAIIPAVQDCYLTVVKNTAIDDWGFDLLKVESVDAINITAKINISRAGATAGATAKLGLKVGNS